MKLRTLFWSLFLAIAWLPACEENAEEAPPAEEAAGEAKPAEGAAAAGEAAPAEEVKTPSAVDVCKVLIDAAKAKDAEKIIANATAPAGEALAADEAKEGMFGALAEATCAEEATTSEETPDKAVVNVTAGETTREIPFVKDGDAWKFDFAAYAEKYPADEKAGKKGKKAPPAKKKMMKKMKKKG